MEDEFENLAASAMSKVGDDVESAIDESGVDSDDDDATLQAELVEAERVNLEARRELAQKTWEIEVLQNCIGDLTCQLEQLKRQYSAETVQLSTENSQLKERISELQSERDTLEGRVQVLECTVKELGDKQEASNKKQRAIEEDIKRSLNTTDGPNQHAAPAGGPRSDYKHLQEAVQATIMKKKATTKWDDIIGLKEVKEVFRQQIMLPVYLSKKVDHNKSKVTSENTPVQGMLLFGPPGNGKTLLAKATATECECTFFNVSCADLYSRWLGENEKFIKFLFEEAHKRAPSIIFVDEIDSIGCKRSSDSHEASRRTMTELLNKMDGVQSASPEFVMVLGATNRPWDIDPALRRRLSKQVYIPMPDEPTRLALLERNLEGKLTKGLYVKDLLKETDGCTCDDVVKFCCSAKDQTKYRITREWSKEDMMTKEFCFERCVTDKDIFIALKMMTKSVPKGETAQYEDWNKQHGVKYEFIFS